MLSPGSSRRFRPTIRLTVVGIFFIATVCTAALAVGLQYYFSRSIATEAAVDRFNDLADSAEQFLRGMDEQAVRTTRVLASYPGLVREQWVNDGAAPLFAEIMQDSPMLYAIYLGFDNGDFFELINLDSGAAVRHQLQAEPSDRWVVIGIRGEGDARRRTLAFYDANFQLRGSRQEVSDYSANSRPWFRQATVGEVHKTAPYLFHNLQAPGQTYSMRMDGAGAVIAVDIALSSLSHYLSEHPLSDSGRIFLYRQSGELIASNQAHVQRAEIPAITPLSLSDAERALVAAQGVLRVSNELDWVPIDFAVAGQPQGYSIDLLGLIAQLTGLRFEFVNGYRWPELVAQFRAGDIDILQPLFDNSTGALPGQLSDPFLQLPYSVITRPGHKSITHFRELAGATVAVPEGWTIIEALRTQFPEVQIQVVPSGRAMFDAVRSRQADAGIDAGEILRHTSRQYFIDDLQFHDAVAFAPATVSDQLHVLVSERLRPLLPLINRAIAAITDEQRAALAERWFSGVSTPQTQASVPYAELVDLTGQPTQLRQLLHRSLDGERHYLFVAPVDGHRAEYLGIVVPELQVLKPALEQVRWAVALTIGILLLLAPAPWLFASPIVGPIKKLALENEKIRRREYDHLDIPDSHIKEIHELGVSMGNMAGAIRQYEANQRAFMDAFIELIAQAIDQKSPYTAGHCERVPELAVMLAQKAHESRMPAFQAFSFASDDAWREFRIGAWLHDCGKITTPEHIVDKGSKLELIYNRIHEVRMRFEVLWRDAEIRYWQDCKADPGGEPRYRADLMQTQSALQDDFAFVARMNVGGEHLEDADKQRLHALAERRWIRHFSNRLGLSPLEESRLTGEEPALPCPEPLLADRPEHIVAREYSTDYAPRLGITMTVPEHLYNQGEIYNLLIERGTLTAEDRFKINEHIIGTIRMLDTLPLPSELAQVPRFASTHHESLDGTGYPRGLTGDALSIPERIMVLADIFEALTAADRPYKKAKPISEAVAILHRMVEDQHVDADVFALFLTSGVYLDYAREYLAPEQIDAVDIGRYVHSHGGSAMTSAA